jgi:hypothetical protein
MEPCSTPPACESKTDHRPRVELPHSPEMEYAKAAIDRVCATRLYKPKSATPATTEGVRRTNYHDFIELTSTSTSLQPKVPSKVSRNPRLLEMQSFHALLLRERELTPGLDFCAPRKESTPCSVGSRFRCKELRTVVIIAS